MKYSHDEAIAAGRSLPRKYMVLVPDYYFITKGNTLSDDLEDHYGSQEEAQARADALNTADVLASLDLEAPFIERRSRLQMLGKTFAVCYGQGHPESRWPVKPGRYAVESYDDRYSQSFWETVETLDDVETEIRSGDVERVVDLDTGDDLGFEINVRFG